MGTFISLGNAKQSFSRMLKVIDDVMCHLPKPIIIQSGHTFFESNVAKVYRFMTADDFKKYIKNSEIIIIHAGAGSIINAIKQGKTPLVMARSKKYNEHVNNHQFELLNKMMELNKVLGFDNPETLKLHIEKIKNSNNTNFFVAEAESKLSIQVKKSLINLNKSLINKQFGG